MRLATARAIDRSVILLATVCLAANSYNVPSREFWEASIDGARSYVLLGLLLVVGLFGAFTPTEALSGRARENRNVAIRRQILNSFGRLLEAGETVTPPLDMGDLGLHVWRRRRSLRHPLKGILARVSTYRLGTSPVNRPFTPTRGQGVVGLCWKLDQDIGVDVESLARGISNPKDYADHVRTHGGDSVMNLSWDDFQRVKHRGAVLASPIRNGRNRFVGCLSVDASHGFNVLNSQEVKSQMSLLCVVISQVGFESV